MLLAMARTSTLAFSTYSPDQMFNLLRFLMVADSVRMLCAREEHIGSRTTRKSDADSVVVIGNEGRLATALF